MQQFLGLSTTLFLLATSHNELGSMLNELGDELREVADLQLQDLKLEFMSNPFVPDSNSVVWYRNVPVKKVDQLVCLGSVIRIDLQELDAYHHRVRKA